MEAMRIVRGSTSSNSRCLSRGFGAAPATSPAPALAKPARAAMEAALAAFAPTTRVARLLVAGRPERLIEIPLTAQEQRIFHVMLATVRARALGTTVRVAGGWVRDKLLGRPNDDIDFAVDNMKGSEFAAHVVDFLKSECPALRTGSVGVIQANPEQSKHLETATTRILDTWLDFAHLRTDVYEPGSRIPVVAIGTPTQDAERRDLTFNALFYNLSAGAVEDYTGMGVADLEAGLVRTPLPPRETFLDDPLRVLRTVRFATRFGFRIEAGVRAAIASRGGDGGGGVGAGEGVGEREDGPPGEVLVALATKVSRERIGIEVDAMLAGPRPVAALRSLYALGLLPLIGAAPGADAKIAAAGGGGNVATPSANAEAGAAVVIAKVDLRLAGRLTLPPAPPCLAAPKAGERGLRFPASCVALATPGEGGEGALSGLTASQLPATWPALAMPVVEALDYLFAVVPGPAGLGDFAAREAGSPQAMPPCGAVGFCVPRDADATEAPEALADHAAPPRAPAADIWPAEARRVLTFAALLSPFASALGLVGSAARPEPLAGVVLSLGLKQPNKLVVDVLATLAGAQFFSREVGRRGADRGEWEPDRLAVGQLLRREARELWPLSLYLSAAMQLAHVLHGPLGAMPAESSRSMQVQEEPAVPSLLAAAAAVASHQTATSNAPADISRLGLAAAARAQVAAVLAAHGRLANRVRSTDEALGGWALEGCWAWRPLLDGKALAELTGAKGSELGALTERQAEWRLLHPAGSEAELRAFVLPRAAAWIAEARAEFAAATQAKAAASKAKTEASREGRRKDKEREGARSGGAGAAGGAGPGDG